MNKIKELLSAIGIIFLIALFGFTPVERQVAFALDWGNIGMRMIETGVVDKEKMENLHVARGGLTESDRKMMYGNNNKNFKITPENQEMSLHMLWALGLGNKNQILETGPMMVTLLLLVAGRLQKVAQWTITACIDL